MPFGKKYGGRTKGTPNKSTLPLKQKAEELGIDPFKILLLFAEGDWQALGYKEEQFISSANDNGTYYKYTIDPSVRKTAAKEACEFIFPKLKAIEHTGKDGESLAPQTVVVYSSQWGGTAEPTDGNANKDTDGSET